MNALKHVCTSLIFSLLGGGMAQESSDNPMVTENNSRKVQEGITPEVGNMPVFAQGTDDPITWLSKQKGKGLSNEEVSKLLLSIMEFYKNQLPVLEIGEDFKEKNPTFFKEVKSFFEYEVRPEKVIDLKDRKSLISQQPIPTTPYPYNPKWGKITQQLKLDFTNDINSFSFCQKDVFSLKDKKKIELMHFHCVKNAVHQDKSMLYLRFEEITNNKTWVRFFIEDFKYNLGKPIDYQSSIKCFEMGIEINDYIYFVRFRNNGPFYEPGQWNFFRTQTRIKENTSGKKTMQDYFSFGEKGVKPSRNQEIGLTPAILSLYYLDAYDMNGKCLSLKRAKEFYSKGSKTVAINEDLFSKDQESHPLNLFSERSKDLE